METMRTRLTPRQRSSIVLAFQNGTGSRAIGRQFGIPESTVRGVIANFKKTGGSKAERAKRQATVRSKAMVGCVARLIARNPLLPIRGLARQVGINRKTMDRLIKRDLGLKYDYAYDSPPQDTSHLVTAQDKHKPVHPSHKSDSIGKEMALESMLFPNELSYQSPPHDHEELFTDQPKAKPIQPAHKIMTTGEEICWERTIFTEATTGNDKIPSCPQKIDEMLIDETSCPSCTAVVPFKNLGSHLLTHGGVFACPDCGFDGGADQVGLHMVIERHKSAQIICRKLAFGALLWQLQTGQKDATDHNPTRNPKPDCKPEVIHDLSASEDELTAIPPLKKNKLDPDGDGVSSGTSSSESTRIPVEHPTDDLFSHDPLPVWIPPPPRTSPTPTQPGADEDGSPATALASRAGGSDDQALLHAKANLSPKMLRSSPSPTISPTGSSSSGASPPTSSTSPDGSQSVREERHLSRSRHPSDVDGQEEVEKAGESADFGNVDEEEDKQEDEEEDDSSSSEDSEDEDEVPGLLGLVTAPDPDADGAGVVRNKPKKDWLAFAARIVHAIVQSYEGQADDLDAPTKWFVQEWDSFKRRLKRSCILCVIIAEQRKIGMGLKPVNLDQCTNSFEETKFRKRHIQCHSLTFTGVSKKNIRIVLFPECLRAETAIQSLMAVRGRPRWGKRVSDIIMAAEADKKKTSSQVEKDTKAQEVKCTQCPRKALPIKFGKRSDHVFKHHCNSLPLAQLQVTSRMDIPGFRGLIHKCFPDTVTDRRVLRFNDPC